MNRRQFNAALATVALGAAARSAAAQQKRTLAFVVNVSADFWTIARRGIEKANREHPEFDMQMIIPGQASAAEQRRILDELLARQVAGVAISPINPASSTDALNRVASQTLLFTTDSDAPASNRLVYIGTDNVAAGRDAGAQMKRALPGGGKAIRAEVPLAEMFGYSTTLRSLTQGRATYTMEFKHYAEAPKSVAEAVISAKTK